jgi:Kdo2-lipid IVA lauroyltransferase/acyltransferase
LKFKNSTVMQFLTFVIFLFFVFIFWLIPFSILYKISDLLYLILYYIIRYRRKVVRKNLKDSFPEKTKNELLKIEKLFYKNLTDIILEGIKGFSMSNKQVIKRFKFNNAEVFDSLYDRKQSFIAVLGHFCNWEWGTISAGLQLKFNIVGFYKPLSNKYIDKFLKNNRSKSNTTLASISKTYQTFDDFKNKTTIFVMIADQSPGNIKRAMWFNFLGRPTAWIHGPEKYAKLFDFPVYFIHVERIKRGYYVVKVKEIEKKSKDVPTTEITRKYIEELEKIVKDKPENWLWSHNRWKIKYQEIYRINN